MSWTKCELNPTLLRVTHLGRREYIILYTRDLDKCEPNRTTQYRVVTANTVAVAKTVIAVKTLSTTCTPHGLVRGKLNQPATILRVTTNCSCAERPECLYEFTALFYSTVTSKQGKFPHPEFCRIYFHSVIPQPLVTQTGPVYWLMQEG